MSVDSPISTIMSLQPTAVRPDQDLASVHDVLARHGMHHVPVVVGNRFIGLISSNDLLRVTTSGPDLPGPDAVRQRLSTMTAREVMTEDVVTIGPGDSIRRAGELLMDGGMHALPVVAADELVGMVTSTDLIRWAVEQR